MANLVTCVIEHCTKSMESKYTIVVVYSSCNMDGMVWTALCPHQKEATWERQATRQLSNPATITSASLVVEHVFPELFFERLHDICV